MNFRKTNAQTSIVTRNTHELDNETGNVYKSVLVMSKRANQINKMLKEELNQKLTEFASANDNLDEIFENREQIEVSKFYEGLPKPPSIAIQEYLDGKIYFRDPETTTEQ